MHVICNEHHTSIRQQPDMHGKSLQILRSDGRPWTGLCCNVHCVHVVHMRMSHIAQRAGNVTHADLETWQPGSIAKLARFDAQASCSRLSRSCQAWA